MIVVRNVFKLKFGKTKEAVSLMKEMQVMANKQGFGRAPARLLTDLVATFYTIVLEHTFESMADFENQAKNMMVNNDWKAWYQKLTPLIESGHREIFTIVE